MTLAVPEAEMMFGASEPQLSPVGTVSVRLTVPVNPLRETTVMDELVRVETSTGAGEEALMVKSVTVTAAVVLWDRVPLAPVTVIL